jgi:MtN3 and saliva related transmembrane protein
MDNIMILGFAGGFLLGIQMIPQLYKTWKTKSAKDISWTFMICNIIGLSCMVLYGIFQNDFALYIPASISLSNTIFLSFMKFYFDKK